MILYLNKNPTSYLYAHIAGMSKARYWIHACLRVSKIPGTYRILWVVGILMDISIVSLSTEPNGWTRQICSLY